MSIALDITSPHQSSVLSELNCHFVDAANKSISEASEDILLAARNAMLQCVTVKQLGSVVDRTKSTLSDLYRPELNDEEAQARRHDFYRVEKLLIDMMVNRSNELRNTRN